MVLRRSREWLFQFNPEVRFKEYDGISLAFKDPKTAVSAMQKKRKTKQTTQDPTTNILLI